MSLNKSLTAAWNVNAAAAPPAPRQGKRGRALKLNDSDGTATPTSAPASDKEEPVKKRRTRPREDKEDKYAPPEARLSQLGGLNKQITQLLEIVALPLLHPEIYTHTGVPRPRGVLLHGVPGGGKTQLVKCLAGDLGLPFITVSAPSIVSGMSGESERALREHFDEAKVGPL